MGSIKEPIYILPGWTYRTDKWGDLINNLEKKGASVRKLKIPGLESKIDRPWSISDYIDWLHDKLKSEKKAVLIGHSNGGRISTSYSLAHPEKVSKLILIDSAGLIDKSLSLKVKKIIFKILAEIGNKSHLPNSSKKLLYKLAREKDYYKADPNLKSTMKSLIKLNLESQLESLKVPTTIIWGKDDKVTPLEFAEIFHSKIKNSELYVINGAKHSPQYTHHEKVSEIIVNSLK